MISLLYWFNLFIWIFIINGYCLYKSFYNILSGFIENQIYNAHESNGSSTEKVILLSFYQLYLLIKFFIAESTTLSGNSKVEIMINFVNVFIS
jgi:hypothetical protein